ncbi:MAG: HD domain-containing phosphohydrolase [Armatimonadota bacterium]|nr:HD domain-containing phosphohydrolase [Armatimonadota bacterium]
MHVQGGDRARLHQAYRRRTSDFLAAAARRDQTAGAHSERVTRYALAIGKVIGLSPDELTDLKYAAALHDVGKIAVSRRLLNRLGKLTNEDLEVMKRHSELSMRVLERIEGLRLAAVLVKYHHERYDGKGCPAGLCGIEIPLGSRIIAVAEAFDILTSDVPWRPAMDQQSALAELQRCAGTQFDPEVVEALFIATANGYVER